MIPLGGKVLCTAASESVFKICCLVFDVAKPPTQKTSLNPLHLPMCPAFLPAPHFTPWTGSASLTLPFPCPCRCVLNACSSYRCHSGVRPGVCRGLHGVAQLAEQLHQKHELRQPRLPQDHRRGRGGRDPHRAVGRHGTPRAPPPVPARSQHGCGGSRRRHLPAVHRPATGGQHARPGDSLVHGAAHALHGEVTPGGGLRGDGRSGTCTHSESGGHGLSL